MTLLFDLPRNHGTPAVQPRIDRLVVAGWAGRDAAAIEHHILELEAIGVARPSAVPLFYRVAANQLTQEDVVEVVGAQTSGEVEPLLFFDRGEVFVSVASDHTDRALETHSVALSKQVCAKPVARSAWRLADVVDRWDSLVLRSWIVGADDRVAYQAGTLATLLPPAALLERFAATGAAPGDGLAMSCGTVPVIGGIRPTGRFRIELFDPRDRLCIAHEYRCLELPVVA